MPGGDFAGYAAQLQWVRDALLAQGRVPRWCVECYGGSAVFTSHTKELLALPLALLTDPVTATKAAWVLWRVLSALGLYLFAARVLGAPAAGIAAGYAYAFGAVPNAQGAHLDMALAAALLPFFWIALVEHFRSGGLGWTLALAALTALLFANNWVYAVVAPVAALGVWALRPWPGRALAPGWAPRSAAALALFCVFAASSVAWLLADAPHHWLKAGENFAPQREFFVERSPFLFFNRAGWLDAWLSTHSPLGVDLALYDGDRRYLGFAVLLLAALGAALAPRGGALRRAAALGTGLFLFQYWLALGPHTLLWQLGGSFGLSEAAQGGVALALRATALGCGGAALWLWRRERTGAAGLGVTALLACLPTLSLWSGLAALLPPFAAQRSPGHFFDTAPFWLCLAFAAGLASLLRRAPSPAWGTGAAAAALALVALDFAPSRHPFSAGEPLAPLREAAALVGAVEGEGGTLRALPPPGYGPRSSWLIAQSELGHAWGWLDWQAGRAWAERLPALAYPTPVRKPDGSVWLEPDSQALAALRVGYFLLPEARARLPEPWRRVGTGGPFALWQQPEVAPMAQGLRGEGSAESDFEVAYSRPAPERIRLDYDAGPEPGVLRLNESYHPWWHARAAGEALAVRAEGSVMELEVGPGPGRVELRFERPFGVAASDGLSAVAWIALLPALALRAGWRRRQGL